ncbi:replication initiator [Streptomyces caeruleatus]|uniref:Plasmid replication initiator protein n=1 Tax=Streptomyces caeruleatus TaxID=661399 RepID=A0A117RQV2_9ACTN|nr:replication initiator [Streptomyces caeruleatus]KUO04279.1 plasmid replication initiator protein [Streptomyces caeruleatus]
MYPLSNEARRSVLGEAERLRRLSPTERDLIRLVHEPGFPRWLEQIKSIGGCAHPIYLAGHTTTHDAVTGEVLRHYDTRDEPGGRMPVRCRNRRETRCEPCSYLHAGDTFHLVRSGLLGGKGVTDDVQRHPRLFVTLTAPSFGAVHRVSGPDTAVCRPRRDGGMCEHGRPLGCGHQHADADSAVGQPLCPDCYDYAGHVLWHASAGTLWNRYCHMLRRHLATAAGITQTRLREHLTVSFAKVAEYQKRGAVHFHAVIRLDGPDGPSSPPPPWATTELLEGAVRSAADLVEVNTPYSPATGERAVKWGKQLDVHPIRSDAFTESSAVTDNAVAAYVAKYVSKSVGDAGGIDYRIRDFDSIRLAPVNAHLRALMAACWRLGGLVELEELRLRAWAHTLGYRGHVLTKSRQYSTTYGALRAVRAEHQSGGGPLVLEDSDTVTESAWRYIGSGHSPAESDVAVGIAEDLAALREIRRDMIAEGWKYAA